MSEKSETESERDLDGIDVVSEPDASSKRSSLRSGTGGVIDRNDSSPAPHQVSLQKMPPCTSQNQRRPSMSYFEAFTFNYNEGRTLHSIALLFSSKIWNPV